MIGWPGGSAEPATLAAVDDQAVEAALTRSPKQLAVWLLRLIVQLEPLAFEQRHRRALAERRVIVLQGVDGMGYVTGEVSAADAAAIDATLAAAARSLGAEDPRNDQQRRADVFADLLLGRLGLTEPADPDQADDAAGDAAGGDWLEVEDVDLETGELLGTRWQQLDEDGEVIGEPVDQTPTAPDGALRLDGIAVGAATACGPDRGPLPVLQGEAVAWLGRSSRRSAA